MPQCRILMSNSIVNGHNAEFSELAVLFFETPNSIMQSQGFLAKPRRARPETIISVVALLVKAVADYNRALPAKRRQALKHKIRKRSSKYDGL